MEVGSHLIPARDGKGGSAPGLVFVHAINCLVRLPSSFCQLAERPRRPVRPKTLEQPKQGRIAVPSPVTTCSALWASYKEAAPRNCSS